MGKTAQRYLEADAWRIREKGFHPQRSRVSESLFSLANEFMGVRGYFEEGYDGERMVGSYFNGVFEEENLAQMPAFSFRGMIERSHGLANAVDWLFLRIAADGEPLDLAHVRFSDFERWTDMQTGCMCRAFTWHTQSGTSLRLAFERFLSMNHGALGCQRVTLRALEGSCRITLQLGLDFGIPQYTQRMTRQWDVLHRQADPDRVAVLGRVKRSGHCVFASARFAGLEDVAADPVTTETYAGIDAAFDLAEGQCRRIDRMAVHGVRRDPPVDVPAMWTDQRTLAREAGALSYDDAFERQKAVWASIWKNLDIEIDGDPDNQQGLRYCLFQLYQSYRGEDHTLNVTAKGLSSEYYYGWTWWDTETYCLPFYMFNNPAAARKLLQYRHVTLPGALERARQVGGRGARYPMGTIDGTEAVPVWQHGDLEIHVSAAVAFGLRHYAGVTGDYGMLREFGLEILLQICRFYAGRGQWSPQTGEFGFWGVMGADEFHMMVHNNFYTNFMVQQAFETTLAALESVRVQSPGDYRRIVAAVQLDEAEPAAWRHMAEKMRLHRTDGPGVIEQHDGFFDLPHLDLGTVPPEQFPLYEHWPYLDIFRWDFIKQPDVLLAMFLFGSRFSKAEKIANYDYYEPRCIHESSLSPSIHSILAAEIGRHEDALKYFQQATRLDLDDYNRNTWQGLHTTSMAGAYMNIVYGFGGMRSDGGRLAFAPALPDTWNRLRFRLHVQESVIELDLARGACTVRLIEGRPVRVDWFGQTVEVTPEGVTDRQPPGTSRLQAVIFDLDGVVVSTDELHYRAWKRLAEEQGIPFDRKDNERLRGISRLDSLDILLERATRSFTPEQKAALAGRKNGYYRDRVAESLSAADILPGAIAFLDACKAAGLKVATGSSSRNGATILRQIGLDGAFDATVDGNDIRRSKPDPEVFLAAARRLRISPEACLVVEDAVAGVEAAAAAGMKCLAVGSAAGHPAAALSAPSLAEMSLKPILKLYAGPAT